MIKKIKFKSYGILLLTLCLWIVSCRTTDNSIENSGGSANVIIRVVGAESGSGTSTSEKKASVEKGTTSDNGIQKFVIPFDETSFVTATLSPERSVVKAQASVNPMAATSITELGESVQYKVAVYDGNGDFVDEKNFTYGQRDPGFQLNGGQNYTFVAYSVNRTSTVPDVSNTPRTLATDKLTNVSGDLMYFKKNMTVSGNDTNYLEVVLKHKYSQITTKLDARQVGNISLVDNASIGLVSASANMNLTDGSLTYNSPGSVRTPVNDFQPLNTEVVTSDPTILISNTTNTAELNIETLIIGGIFKNNFKVSNLNVRPGEKYNLNLRFGPCVQDRAFPFTVSSEVTTDSVQFYPKTSKDSFGGFVLDFYRLRNSFNLHINHQSISTEEIRFGRGKQNIRFADGSIWGDDNTSDITTMSGTKEYPLIRVVISKEGIVSMYGQGMKPEHGFLEPLYLSNGTFNDISWRHDDNQNNTIEVSQDRGGAQAPLTGYYMSGLVTLKQIVPCTP